MTGAWGGAYGCKARGWWGLRGVLGVRLGLGVAQRLDAVEARLEPEVDDEAQQPVAAEAPVQLERHYEELYDTW